MWHVGPLLKKMAMLGLILPLASGIAAGCWMAPAPPTKLQGTAVIGRFTYEGKPLKRSRVQIRMNGKLLSTALTDNNGYYSFAVSEWGFYQIKMLNPSFETFAIEFIPSTSNRQILDINYYADYCYQTSVKETHHPKAG